EQAEASDLHGEWIDVHTIHTVQRLLREIRQIASRLLLRPKIEQSSKRAKQEVTRAARRIDEPHVFVTEGGDCGIQCAIEDEFLHEFRGLQERIAFARRFGEVLIEIA